ncbi:isoamyl alcohol oxidase [Mytilinidion resinicola]|uniref:Isoamyl alcohol oxidase n=1 Tax=Mytilinidion resinicola TaxID=574789 RepID=A0A6A6YBS2_9PEZI|nr:isoamyl alcohol oxidase [Mytilinidion resinicola]KAF2805464.1 isoamyl alcohol oxidase [Mytilinidion resinicola]
MKPSTSPQCRCIPQDPCWPSTADWDRLNDTLSGRLIATVPLAHVCHDPQYNQTACDALKKGWPYIQTHASSPSSFVSPLAQNQSCDPFTSALSKCQLGNEPIYAVNVSSPDHIAETLKFAHLNNIRVIVKNTGHDLLGKSSGSGSLSIWVHSLKEISITKTYSGANAFLNYSGPAARLGAGVMVYEALEASSKEGLRVLGGTCPTVASAGGYTTGGGHSILSSKYGLSADNVLEWEVVTANGEHIIATPSSNADLYWALSGGGAGVFAVVVSMTVKAFPEGVMSAASLSFNISSSPSEDIFWSAVEDFHQLLPQVLEDDVSAGYVIVGGSFSLRPLTAPDKTKEYVTNLVSPYISKLEQLEIPYTLDVTSFPSYYDMYVTFFGPLPYGADSYPQSEVQTSRLIPQSTLTNQTSELIEAHRQIAALENGSLWIVGNAFQIPHVPSAAPSNSVLPAWRDTVVHQMIVGLWNWTSTWDENLGKERAMQDAVLPLLSAFSSATYLNEGDPNQKDWKEAFYGANFERLEKIKSVWDPADVLYAQTGIGSEKFRSDDAGRLCYK